VASLVLGSISVLIKLPAHPQHNIYLYMS